MTAAEYRQAADEHVRTLKDFWKDFLVSGLFVLAAIVAIFACLAWFAANNRVSATGSTIGAKAARYTLSAAGESESGAHVGYYERSERTEAEKQNIARLDTTDAMTVTLESNLNNESAGSLYPGARGKITFTVTPLADDLNGVTINLSRVLKAMGVTGDGIVADGTTQAPEAQTLLGLSKGHLLFFTNCDQNGYYSGRVANSQIEISKSKFCKGENVNNPTDQPVTIDLYWVWPEYFQNFVLTGNTNYYKNLFAAEGDEYRNLQADMNKNKANYFSGTAGSVEAASAPAVSANMSSADTAICSALYNNADELIGKKVQYIQLRISAQEGVSS